VNYYNEFDPKAAAWLRELIKAGLIPAGDVDERSITDVQPDELTKYTQCHFFAGIGGWPLALQLAGWPATRPVWTGSCPCQPFSAAGKGLGTADERHLWPVFAELIRACKPPTVFGEQVASKAGREWLAGVFADLEGMGYQRAGADLCAASVGAPHIRQRLWWVAHSDLHRTRRAAGREDSEAQETERTSESLGESRAGTGPESGCGGSSERLADATNSRAGRTGQTQPCRDGAHNGIPRKDCGEGIGRLAEVQQSGLEGHAGDGHNGSEPGRNGADQAGSTAESGAFSGMGDAMLHGYSRSEEPLARPRQIHSTDRELERPGAWSDSILIPCRDGKARRVEPSIHPLAHGFPARVAVLKGFGNAIVPQVAAEFIASFLEATR